MSREGIGIKIVLAAGFLAMLAGARAMRPMEGIVALAPAIDFTGGGWRVKVLTWNLGYAYGKGESRARDEDLPAVARVIEAERPDVVALQELSGRRQLRALVARLGGEYRGFVDVGGDADRFAGILVRAPKMEFRSIRTSTGRNASAAIFRVARSPVVICAISAHAQAFDPASRLRYTEEILEWVRERKYDVVFLAGDFNLDVSAKQGGGLVFADDRAADAKAYSAITQSFRDLGRDGGSTAAFGRRIDYVFGLGSKLRVKRVDVLRGRRVGAMDHDPLVVDAVVPKPVVAAKR
jgi:endonuclease/exonuclease/phosphatase family metal-dependent hydrolase